MAKKEKILIEIPHRIIDNAINEIAADCWEELDSEISEKMNLSKPSDIVKRIKDHPKFQQETQQAIQRMVSDALDDSYQVYEYIYDGLTEVDKFKNEMNQLRSQRRKGWEGELEIKKAIDLLKKHKII